MQTSVQASTEQLDSSSAPIYPVADIPAQMCPQFSSNPTNLTVQTEEPANLLHSSPTHFMSRVMEQDFLESHVQTENAVSSVEETHEGHCGNSEMVLSQDGWHITEFVNVGTLSTERQVPGEERETAPNDVSVQVIAEHTASQGTEEPADVEALVPDQRAPAQTTLNNQHPSTQHHCTGEVDIRSQEQDEFVWKISEVAEKWREAGQGTKTCLYSPSISTSSGCELCMRLYLNGDGAGKGTHISVFIDLTGKLDSLLRWMFKHEVSLSLLDQKGGRHISRKIKLNSLILSQGKETEIKIVSGAPKFVLATVLESDSFLNNDCILIKCTVKEKAFPRHN